MAKVLIVDDDPDIVEAMRVVLENKGHNVISAVNVEVRSQQRIIKFWLSEE